MFLRLFLLSFLLISGSACHSMEWFAYEAPPGEQLVKYDSSPIFCIPESQEDHKTIEDMSNGCYIIPVVLYVVRDAQEHPPQGLRIRIEGTTDVVLRGDWMPYLGYRIVGYTVPPRHLHRNNFNNSNPLAVDYTTNYGTAPCSPTPPAVADFYTKQPACLLTKVASDGELSRISLAIQVIFAQTARTPTLVFDEVDVGIGGGTAEIVGNMLREAGDSGQVLCVTHQPQVAFRGCQHLHVSKPASRTTIDQLEGDNRVQEVARMLGTTQPALPFISHKGT